MNMVYLSICVIFNFFHQHHTVFRIWCFPSFSSVAQSCLTLCDPMDRSTPGLPIHHQLPKFTQTLVHWVSDAIQPSHSSVIPFSFRLQSFPASGSFQMSQFFASGGQSIGASAAAISPSKEQYEKEVVTHSSILAWKIPWTEEPGGLQSMRLHLVEHNWACVHILMSWMIVF